MDLFSDCVFFLLIACLSASCLFCSFPVFALRSFLPGSAPCFYFLLISFPPLSLLFLFCPFTCPCLALFFDFLLLSFLLSIHPSVPFWFLPFSLLPSLRNSRAEWRGDAIILPQIAQASVEFTREMGARRGENRESGNKSNGGRGGRQRKSGRTLRNSGLTYPSNRNNQQLLLFQQQLDVN